MGAEAQADKTWPMNLFHINTHFDDWQNPRDGSVHLSKQTKHTHTNTYIFTDWSYSSVNVSVLVNLLIFIFTFFSFSFHLFFDLLLHFAHIKKSEIQREGVFGQCVNCGGMLWPVLDSADKRWSMKADRFTDSRTGALASTKRRHYMGPRSCQDQIVLHIHKHTRL